METGKKPIYINITALAVIKIILIFILFYFLFIIRDILAILFISLILSSALDPWIDWMQKRKIPRALGVIIIYLVIFIFIFSVLLLIIPAIVQQSAELSGTLPIIIDKILGGVNILKEFSIEHGLIDSMNKSFGSISDNFQNAASEIFSTVTGFFGGIFTFFLVLVITFYMTVEENALKQLVWSIIPSKYQIYTMHLINRMQVKIGLWLRGQIILSFVIFTLIYIGLSILNVKYALILAMIAGITEFVPYLGPTLAAIPAIFIAFTQNPTLAIFVAAMYYIVQVAENNLIVPKVMQKVVGLNPIVSIAVLIIGFNLAGVIGAILSIPVATAISVFIKDLFEQKSIDDDKAGID
jgi:predicted PurR-regulated permease PerM